LFFCAEDFAGLPRNAGIFRRAQWIKELFAGKPILERFAELNPLLAQPLPRAEDAHGETNRQA
jgi:hypothetical protein